MCVVDEAGHVVTEHRLATERDEIAVLLTSLGGEYGRVGLEAGPLSQWLVNGLAEAGPPVICVKTQHMMSLLKVQRVAEAYQGRLLACVLSDPRRSKRRVPSCQGMPVTVGISPAVSLAGLTGGAWFARPQLT